MKHNGSPVRHRQPELVPAPGRERHRAHRGVASPLRACGADARRPCNLLFTDCFAFCIFYLYIYARTFSKKKKSIRGACVFGTLQFFSFVAGSRVPSRSAAVISPRNYPLALHVFPRSGNPMCVGVKKSNDVVIVGFLQMASRCAHFSCSRFSQLDTTEILLSHLVVL